MKVRGRLEVILFSTMIVVNWLLMREAVTIFGTAPTNGYTIFGTVPTIGICSRRFV